MSDLEEPKPSGISRRTVTKAMAWSVPAIALAVPAPAYAASGGKPSGVAGPACKLPGASCKPLVKGYLFPLSVTNSTSKTVYLHTSNVIISEDNPDLDLVFEVAVVDGVSYYPGDSIPIPSGETVNILLNAGTEDESSQESLTGSISFTWGHTENEADDTDHIGDPVVIPFSYASTPPCDKCTAPFPA